MLMLVLMILSFLFGAVTILALEALGVVFLIRWMNRKIEKEEEKSSNDDDASVVPDLDPSIYNLQGFLWVLESEKVPKEQKPKKDILEVTPVRKHATIKDRCLVLTELDGSHHTKISLKGCVIEAVSASSLPSKKWAKKFPLKLENKGSEIYKGSKTFYVYLETSWDKETWCKALRLASGDDKEKLKWFAKLNMEFHNYLTSLNAEYPSFMKPSLGINADPLDKSIKMDGTSSKVRQFLRKLAKKAGKNGPDFKSSSSSMSSHGERKVFDKSYSFDDPAFATRSVNTVPTAKPINHSAEDSILPPPSLTSSGSGRSQMSLISDRDPDDRIFADEGSLCWNLLISRLFFDVKSNMQVKTAVQSRIQKSLSSIRIPSYVGEISCTSVHLGNLPPYIHGMRVLPSDMNEVWGMEIDIEYAGGAVLDIETRLEVQELDSHEGVEPNLGSSSVGEVTPDLLEGIEYYGKQRNVSEDRVSVIDQKDEIDLKPDDNKSCKITTRVSTQVSRWKSVLHSVAKQVSQVPISLGIKVTSLRGTLRLYIKSPPSDQLWFGFTSMPHIDFNLESSVGEHKITSGHLALFLISRFKAGIRETLVLPNCESASVPWMVAEVDDWVPRDVAPFIWSNHDTAANTTTKQEAPIPKLGKVASMVDRKESSMANAVEGKYVANAVESKEAPVASGADSKEAPVASVVDSKEAPVASVVDSKEAPVASVVDFKKAPVGSVVDNKKAPVVSVVDNKETPSASSQDDKHDKSVSTGYSTDRTSESIDLNGSLAPTTRITSEENLLQDLRTPLLNKYEPEERIPEERYDYNLRSQSMNFPGVQSPTRDEDDPRYLKRSGTKARMLGLRKKMGEKLEEKRRHLEEKGRIIVEKMRERDQKN